MANKPRKPCGEIGCRNLTEKFYCKIHEKIGEENKQEKVRAYNKYKRDPVIDAFYHSKEWRALRLHVLRRDKYLCQTCKRQGHLTTATIGHHLEEVKDNWERRLDADNVESICQTCHNREPKQSPRGQKV